MVGSTQDFEEFMGRLYEIWVKMGSAKRDKLSRRWPTHGDYRQHDMIFLVDRLYEEIYELKEALDSPDRALVKDEVIDVSSLLDFIWDVLDLGAC